MDSTMDDHHPRHGQEEGDSQDTALRHKTEEYKRDTQPQRDGADVPWEAERGHADRDGERKSNRRNGRQCLWDRRTQRRREGSGEEKTRGEEY